MLSTVWVVSYPAGMYATGSLEYVPPVTNPAMLSDRMAPTDPLNVPPVMARESIYGVLALALSCT